MFNKRPTENVLTVTEMVSLFDLRLRSGVGKKKKKKKKKKRRGRKGLPAKILFDSHSSFFLYFFNLKKKEKKKVSL